MSTKMFTRFSKIIFSRNIVVKKGPLRFNTTTPQEPPKAPQPPPKIPQQPPNTAATGKTVEAGKGKGPVTWKSLSFVLVGGAGLLASIHLVLLVKY